MFKESDQVFNTIHIHWYYDETAEPKAKWPPGTIFEVVRDGEVLFADGTTGIYVREITSLSHGMVPGENLKLNTKINRLLYNQDNN